LLCSFLALPWILPAAAALTERSHPITVSPDRRTFLYSKIIDEGADLVLIENFR